MTLAPVPVSKALLYIYTENWPGSTWFQTEYNPAQCDICNCYVSVVHRRQLRGKERQRVAEAAESTKQLSAVCWPTEHG